MLGFGVIRDDLALVVEVDEVVRVEAVASVDVFVCGEVSQGEDDAGRGRTTWMSSGGSVRTFSAAIAPGVRS